MKKGHLRHAQVTFFVTNDGQPMKYLSGDVISHWCPDSAANWDRDQTG